jgi:hypothetical protein
MCRLDLCDSGKKRMANTWEYGNEFFGSKNLLNFFFDSENVGLSKSTQFHICY